MLFLWFGVRTANIGLRKKKNDAKGWATICMDGVAEQEIFTMQAIQTLHIRLISAPMAKGEQMDRLTERHYARNDYYMVCSEACANDDEICGSCPQLEKIINRLGAYEDTGLTPEQVKAESLRPKGRWEDEYGGKYANPRYRCSVCKKRALYKFERDVLDNWKEVQALTDYCPNCGVKMEG